MSLIQPLSWRYATKKFDDAQKLTTEQLQELLKATQLSPSSYGLQHYKILIVEDKAIREQLREAAYGQSQLTDASQVIVFAAETGINEEYIKDYINQIAQERGVSREDLKSFEDSMLGIISHQTGDQIIAWSHKQAYLALGVLLTAAAEMGIDACPMEGFNAVKFDEILGLKEKGLTTSVIAPIGFRSEQDDYAKFAKVRKPDGNLFIHI